MDPITAIGLASAILTFVDFASKLTHGTYEIYKSAAGSMEDNVNVSVVVKDLQSIVQDLDPGPITRTKHEKALKELAAKCEKLSAKLLKLLEKLTLYGKRSSWKALKVKLESMQKDREVQTMQKQLGEYRSQILLHLNIMLWYDAPLTGEEVCLRSIQIANNSLV